MKSDYERLLKEALTLARRGRGLVSPNPLVGAVVAHGNRIVGRGFHRAFGMAHAEREALQAAGDKAAGASLFVTLEPCCHQGKTPPCTEAIIAAGIKEVVCCMEDPNPVVSGRGFAELERHGISVRRGWSKGPAEELNRPYLVAMTRRRPFVILKWAESLDGKIALASGDARWITGEEARQYAHEDRFFCDAILVGINTVLRDDPVLDYRAPVFQTRKNLLERKKYRKIVLDARLRTPPGAALWANPAADVTLFVSDRAPGKRQDEYRRRGADVFVVPEKNGRLALEPVMETLRKLDVGILLAEGGREVLTSFWEARLADHCQIYIGNRILGGSGSLSPLGGKGVRAVQYAPSLEKMRLVRLGTDVLLEGEPCFPA